MFTHASMLYIFVETPLHAGSGRGLGAVDLPIQRERATGYPLIQASGLKGKLRAEADDKTSASEKEKIMIVFGPDTETMKDENKQYAGALSPSDARILLLPVRSLFGVFAWATSIDVLARFQRDLIAAGVPALNWNVSEPPSDTALVAPASKIVGGGKVVLDELSYTPSENTIVQTIGAWLAQNALPAEYQYWRDKLPTSLVILPKDDFRDFTLFATEVVTRIKLNQTTKTVDKESGALWTEESLPTDTLLYAPLFATKPRVKTATSLKTGEDVIKFVTSRGLKRIQLGGDETVGRGLVTLRFGEVKNV